MKNSWIDDKKFLKLLGDECEKISPVGMMLVKLGKWYLDRGYKNEGFTKSGLKRFNRDLLKLKDR